MSKPRWWGSDKISWTSKKYFANRSLVSGLKLIRILSSGWTRCGEVYRPTFRGNPVFLPWTRRKESINAHVLPFPFVPATWIILRLLMSAAYGCQYQRTRGYGLTNTEWPSSFSHCLIPNMLGVPFRLDSSFPGILPTLGKPFAGSILGLRGRRLLFKTSMALCSSQTWQFINI